MNILKLDSSKISWTTTEMGATPFFLTGVNMSINDDNYFNKVYPIIKNLGQVSFSLIIVKNNNSYVSQLVTFTNIDIVKNTGATASNNFTCQFLIRERSNTIGTPNQCEIYIKYE